MSTAPASSQRTGPGLLSRLCPLALLLLTLGLYGRNVTQSVGEYNDAFHHLMNAVFIYDAASRAAEFVSDPLGFVFEYYRYFPAVNLGYYPPVFPLVAAGFMAFFGVTAVSAQLAVLAFALLMTWFAYAWARLRFEPTYATLSAATLITTPMLVRWGRDIMLDVPVTALVVGSMWQFERLLRSERPRWRDALCWAMLAGLAIWTKQHAIFMLGAFALAIVLEWRWDLLRSLPMLTSGALLLALFGLLVFVTLQIGGTAVGHTVGFSAAQAAGRFNLQQWTVYPFWWLPTTIGWPVLSLSLVGIFSALAGREPFSRPLLAWLLCFYVLHSYMAAQIPRYGCVWIPAFVMLAAIGLRQLLAARGPLLACLLFGLVPAYHVAWGVQLAPPFTPRYAPGMPAPGITQPFPPVYQRPAVPPAYHRATEELADRLAPFYCLTHFPDRPGRPAINFRISLQSRLKLGRDLFDFGALARADQVFRAIASENLSPAEFSKRLRDWNVKYILTEEPRSTLPTENSDALEALLTGLLSGPDYQVVTRFPIRLDRKPFEREVLLYQRVEPMKFIEGARPPIRPRRVKVEVIPVVVPSEQSTLE